MSLGTHYDPMVKAVVDQLTCWDKVEMATMFQLRYRLLLNDVFRDGFAKKNEVIKGAGTDQEAPEIKDLLLPTPDRSAFIKKKLEVLSDLVLGRLLLKEKVQP